MPGYNCLWVEISLGLSFTWKALTICPQETLYHIVVVVVVAGHQVSALLCVCVCVYGMGLAQVITNISNAYEK